MHQWVYDGIICISNIMSHLLHSYCTRLCVSDLMTLLDSSPRPFLTSPHRSCTWHQPCFPTIAKHNTRAINRSKAVPSTIFVNGAHEHRAPPFGFMFHNTQQSITWQYVYSCSPADMRWMYQSVRKLIALIGYMLSSYTTAARPGAGN